MAELETIAAQLVTLNQVYQRNIPNSALEAIARVWLTTLDKLDDQDFITACEHHCAKSPYWPTPAHILVAAESMTPNRPPMVALPEFTPTEEDWKRQQAMAEKYCRTLRLDGKRVAQ